MAHPAPNYCIQRTARKLLVDVMLRWRETPWGTSVPLSVRDELTVMMPEADDPGATEALAVSMTTEFRGVLIAVKADPPSLCWRRRLMPG